MSIVNISPVEVKERIDAGDDLIIVDVRMPYELEISRLENVRHIPMDELAERLQEIPKDKTIVLMCRSGGRSQQAGNYLLSQGWDHARLLNLDGGILAWARDVDPALPRFY